MEMRTFYSTFLNDILRKEQKYYPAISLSRQKIDDAQSKQQDILLVGTAIVSMVTNKTICKYGALIYGAYRLRA